MGRERQHLNTRYGIRSISLSAMSLWLSLTAKIKIVKYSCNFLNCEPSKFSTPKFSVIWCRWSCTSCSFELCPWERKKKRARWKTQHFYVLFSQPWKALAEFLGYLWNKIWGFSSQKCFSSLCCTYHGATCTPIPFVYDAIFNLFLPYIRSATVLLDNEYVEGEASNSKTCLSVVNVILHIEQIGVST